jgi:hypothetical protein
MIQQKNFYFFFDRTYGGIKLYVSSKCSQNITMEKAFNTPGIKKFISILHLCKRPPLVRFVDLPFHMRHRNKPAFSICFTRSESK